MMAAVWCAARRLGSSLLQRTQAAVTADGCQLAPSRLMRCRGLSSEAPKEHASNIQKEGDDCWKELNEALNMAEKLQKRRVFQQRMMSIERATKSVVYGAAKLTILYVAAATAFEAVTKEN